MAFRISAALQPQEDPWYTFLLEAESTQSQSVAGRIAQIFNDLTENQTVTFWLVA
jgi:hypothetical protein